MPNRRRISLYIAAVWPYLPAHWPREHPTRHRRTAPGHHRHGGLLDGHDGEAVPRLGAPTRRHPGQLPTNPNRDQALALWDLAADITSAIPHQVASHPACQ